MSTLASIATINRQTGKVIATTVNWDGGPSEVGLILFNHYKDPQKITHLCLLEEIRSLGDTLAETETYNSPMHRGFTFETKEEYLEYFEGYSADYAYFYDFETEMWECFKHADTRKQINLVEVRGQ